MDSNREVLELFGSWVVRGHTAVVISHRPSQMLFAAKAIETGHACRRWERIVSGGTITDVAALDAHRTRSGSGVP
jgi:hypothetical protein